MKKAFKKLFSVYKEFWKNGLNFEGTETRANFWLTELCHFLMFYIAFLLSMYLFDLKLINNAPMFFKYEVEIYFLLCMIPKLAQQTRRLNTIKFSKWVLLINLLFIFGWPILAIIYLLPAPIETKADGMPNTEKQDMETKVTTKKKGKKKKEH